MSGRSTFACHLHTWHLLGKATKKTQRWNYLAAAPREQMTTLTLPLTAGFVWVPAREQHGPARCCGANSETPASCMQSAV